MLMGTRSAYSYRNDVPWLLFLVLPSPACAESAAPVDRGGPREERAERAFEKARANPLALRAFLVRMPKKTTVEVVGFGGASCGADPTKWTLDGGAVKFTR